MNEPDAIEVLVAVSSKYGATREIGEAIGDALRARGLHVEVASAEDVEGVLRYDAVVLGSAVYAGHWLSPAREFADEHSAELRTRPTWLFSSGPIGDPPRPSEAEAVHVEEVMAATGAREHRVFAGKLDKEKLGFSERAVVFAFRAAEGDFRDWDAIAAWAGSVADALAAQPSSMPSASA